MIGTLSIAGRMFGAAATIAFVAGGVMVGTALVAPAIAQDAAKPADAKAADAAGDEKKSAWVKLCEKAPVSKTEQKEVCITHHERLDPNNGLPIISAAIRSIEGSDKKRFLVTVPLGMAVPPGMQAKIDDMKDPVKLVYTFCLPNGCTAETEATPEIMDKMSTGKTLLVATINAVGEQIGFQVPLVGFKSTFDGKPVDTAKFANARKALLMRIRENMIKRAEAAQKAGDAGAAAPAAAKEEKPKTP
jgi:invasion protein IalB